MHGGIVTGVGHDRLEREQCEEDGNARRYRDGARVDGTARPVPGGRRLPRKTRHRVRGARHHRSPRSVRVTQIEKTGLLF